MSHPTPEQEEIRRLEKLVEQKSQALAEMATDLGALVNQRTAQLERAKKEWERTFDAISDPLAIVSADLRIRRVNLAAAQHAQREVRLIPGSLCHVTLFGREEPCRGCPLGTAASRGAARSLSCPAPSREVPGSRSGPHREDLHGCEAEITDPRRERVFRLSLYPYETAPEACSFVCYYKEVTEEKRLATQIIQSEKMAAIGQLAGGVAHEINNPIGVILSFTQLSRHTADTLKDEELQDNLQEIEKAARRCEKIVRSLLDFSRPSMDDDVAPVCLTETLDSALFLVSTHSAAKTMDVRRQYDPAAPRILGNANQLLQVFLNLIQNAVQAMEGGGTVVLSVSMPDDAHVAAAVQDTGCGIPAENLGRIFDPFFTTKAPGKGTGLGLAITYGIVERHHGRIDVESAVGAGTKFTVTLPIERKF